MHRAVPFFTFRDGGLVRPVTFAVAAVVVALSACSAASLQAGKGPIPANANEVVIADYKFVPQTLTVPVGTTVTWVNRDLAPHTATHRSFGDEPFDTGTMVSGAVFPHTFKTAGSYDYLCVLHQGMMGTIVVQ
jgi:plastocyanin